MIHIDKFIGMVLDDMGAYSVKGIKQQLSEKSASGLVFDYTKTLSNSASYSIFAKSSMARIGIEKYGMEINDGYTASDAEKRASNKGSETYISELKEWFERKIGLSEKESLGAAIRTFKKHLKEGYKSRRMGKGGNEGFVNVVQNRLERDGTDMVFDRSDELTMAIYRELLDLATEKFKIKIR